MYAVLIRLPLMVLCCGALALFISFCQNSTADEAADEKFMATEKAKLHKKVERFFRKGKGDHFAIAVIENTFHTEVKRTTVRNVVVNAAVLQDNATEFRTGGEYFPVPAVEFHVIEGPEAAVDAVVDHMAQYIRPRQTKKDAGSKAKAMDAPPPIGDWRLIGRFTDVAKAESALTDARTAFDAIPNWKIDAKEPNDLAAADSNDTDAWEVVEGFLGTSLGSLNFQDGYYVKLGMTFDPNVMNIEKISEDDWEIQDPKKANREFFFKAFVKSEGREDFYYLGFGTFAINKTDLEGLRIRLKGTTNWMPLKSITKWKPLE